MNFTHSVISNTKEYLEKSNIEKDTIAQQLSLHERNYHFTDNKKDYAFERLVMSANKYKSLVSIINTHVKKKENHVIPERINLLQQTTDEIIKYAKELIESLEKDIE